MRRFQSTLPRGERPLSIRPPTPIMSVSIHAPARGATLSFVSRLLQGFVSIHAPARGATFILACQSTAHIVSIHAPARGATILFLPTIQPLEVSIHAPARGATRAVDSLCAGQRFQSTLPRGERLPMFTRSKNKNSGFNPRSREGSDFSFRTDSLCKHSFQSTLPRGERRRT